MTRSLVLIQDRARSYGQQKALAQDIEVSEVELSRLLHDHAPKLIKLLSVLDLEVTESNLVVDLRKVLKAVL